MSFNEDKIQFQTYSWVYGTTSFRVSELKYKIEKQLLLLKELHRLNPNAKWKDLQESYFFMLVDAGLSQKSAKNIKKDARQKSSSLKDLGLVDAQRKITPIGEKFIQLIETKLGFDNFLSLRDDSFYYFKQFLKIEFSKNSDPHYKNFQINPFLALIYVLVKLGSISNDFFQNLLPIQKNFDEVRDLVSNYTDSLDINETILEKIKSMENYENALGYFLANAKNQKTFETVFLNMKGGDKDLPYKGFYELLVSYKLAKTKEEKISKLENIADYISKDLPSSLLKNPYYKILFSTEKKPKKDEFNSIIERYENSFLYKYTTNFDKNFFYLVHLVKWLTNLKEYHDNNKRFLGLCDAFIFENEKITLNPIVKVYFEDIIDDLVYEIVSKDEYTKKLHEDLSLEDINPKLKKDNKLYQEQLKKEFPDIDVNLDLQKQIIDISKKDKKSRFDALIDKYFDTNSIIQLLKHTQNRNDKEILRHKNIGWEADIPTIFEYIIGISWYEITKRKSDINDFLNMNLDASLLPIRFAGGGQSDIVCKYPKEDILIEVTLSSDENQRRMELEPVSRHLGKYRLENKKAYGIFIAPYLDPNVLVGFRSYKNLKYYDKNNTSNFVEGLKIIPLSVEDIMYILESNISYNDLYDFFNNAYEESETDGYIWYHKELKSKLRELLCN